MIDSVAGSIRKHLGTTQQFKRMKMTSVTLIMFFRMDGW